MSSSFWQLLKETKGSYNSSSSSNNTSNYNQQQEDEKEEEEPRAIKMAKELQRRRENSDHNANNKIKSWM